MNEELVNNNKKIKLYDMPTRIKELEFIQDVITRLSNRQSEVKTLCMTVLGGIFTIASIFQQDIHMKLISFVVSLVLLMLFSFLDFDFLKKEKLYRLWYDFICWKRSETCQWLFELNPINIDKILKEESGIFEEFHPDRLQMKWHPKALPLYLVIAVLLILFYLPTFWAAFLTHSSM